MPHSLSSPRQPTEIVGISHQDILVLRTLQKLVGELFLSLCGGAIQGGDFVGNYQRCKIGAKNIGKKSEHFS